MITNAARRLLTNPFEFEMLLNNQPEEKSI